MGIGAGWMKSDYDQSGIAYDAPGVRVSRMEEGIAIIKGCFAPGPQSFEGEHYTITDYDGLPKPHADAAADPHRWRRQASALDRRP